MGNEMAAMPAGHIAQAVGKGALGAPNPRVVALAAGAAGGLAAGALFNAPRDDDEAARLRLLRVRSSSEIKFCLYFQNGKSQRIGLYDASLSGDLNSVKSCLVDGTSANSSNKRNRERTPLHAAAEKGHEGIVRLLLREEADVNAKDREGLTPIHLAALKGHVNVFRLLLNGGANINMKAKGMKVIHFAAIGGQVLLLEVLETVCELSEKTDCGMTPLHLAAKQGNLTTVLWLVEQGVSFSLRDNRGNTAEDLAREKGHTEIAGYLNSWILLQQRKFLQVVAQGKLVNIMSFFKAGVDVDCKTQEEDEWGLRAIHLASLYGHLEVVKALVVFGARREAEDDMGSTAVHYAAAGGHVGVLKFLKENGCKLDVCNNLSMTPLHFAAIRGKTETASWLLEQGVVEDTKTSTGLSAADIAKREGHLALSRSLGNSTSSLERTKISKGNTALVSIKKKLGSGAFGTVYLASMNGREIVVKEIKLNSESEKEDLKPDESEVQILKCLKHPNIVTFVGCHVEKNTLNILMECCSGGDLAQRIKQQKARKEVFQERLVVNWARKIASALHYIHRKGILHRDLKPENIFLSGSDSIKLGDFGLAKLIEGKRYATSVVGTAPYMLIHKMEYDLFQSPEVRNQCPYNEKSDMWSFGCILYELASFQKDFTNFKVDKISKKFNSEYIKLVSSLLEKEPVKRPCSSQVISLPLFKTSRPRSHHQEMYQRQLTEALRDIERNTNNLLNLVLSL
ncbi:ankyrin-1-like [Macrobrachium nipponense]|uniref:ankyrin-1-like n=1 Tax=Macrobrachium nipponense TaxID=159736 RepID=UPI0030C7B0FB